ncbi:hypothetical protein EVAR_71795_1 [Eumeta japonica]|uniref:Uncharacterized protein n=1 Tax=Eumeta variegata TaxID=151549 RepID=A0A4C1T436_EUMVA|nr:hypothetical protein EVAR_71795_1 [Eumeta japonica]
MITLMYPLEITVSIGYRPPDEAKACPGNEKTKSEYHKSPTPLCVNKGGNNNNVVLCYSGNLEVKYRKREWLSTVVLRAKLDEIAEKKSGFKIFEMENLKLRQLTWDISNGG